MRYFILSLLISIQLDAYGQSCHNYKNCIPDSKKSMPSTLADDQRSDTINLLHTELYLKVTDFSTKNIVGRADLKLVPKMNNVSTVSFDLLKFIVDSVEQNNANLSFSYNDTVLIAALPAPIGPNDTITLSVFYHGVPQVDPQWGGFYIQSPEAYNLGVGFAANPHVYGRSTFPCFDNFLERSSYTLHLTSNGGKISYANGLLTNDTTDVNGLRTRTWELKEEIPSYLVGLSVGPYADVKDEYISITGDTIPVMLSGFVSDTNKIKGSFINLPTAFSCFENAFGPYIWPKVGYMIVPNGAMEHPTAVSYPRSIVNGTTTNEDIMAHELAHHWFGDLATCSNEGDMWINEGMATFCQYFFFECKYGKTSYKNQIRANHNNLVHTLHYSEGGFRPLSGMPHSLTYGTHVYNKGGDVAHTLRGYLGDSLFFAGLKYVLTQYHLKPMSSAQMRDALTAGTGVNMNHFFQNWVFSGGWPNFTIDSFTVIPNVPNYDVTVWIKQKLHGAPALYDSVPLDLEFSDLQRNKAVRRLVVSGASTQVQVSIPISPVFAMIDAEERISDAVTFDRRSITAPGTYFSSVANGRMQVVVSALTPGDSAHLLVDHNWAPADPFKTPNPLYKLSTYRSWKVSGIFPPLFDATATIVYDGRGSGGYLDSCLLTANNQEDSIVLMYRKNSGDEWSLFPWTTKNMNNLTDKFGTIKIDSLLPGEYALAFSFAPGNGISETIDRIRARAYPNPFSNAVTIEVQSSEFNADRWELNDVYGRVIRSGLTRSNTISLSRENLDAGLYFYTLFSPDGRRVSGKLIAE